MGPECWQAVQVPDKPGSLHLHSFRQFGPPVACTNFPSLVLFAFFKSFSSIVHFGVLTTIANMLQFPGLGAKVNGCFSCCLFASPFQLSLSFFISFFHSAHSPQQDMPQGTSKMCCNCLVLSFSFPFLRPHLLLRP